MYFSAAKQSQDVTKALNKTVGQNENITKTVTGTIEGTLSTVVGDKTKKSHN